MKLVVFSAPSGSGKSTIVNYLLGQNLGLEFSISATSRQPRGTEQHGVEYYFLSPEEFREKIAEDAFVEYEEVYTDRFYGTLKSEVQRISDKGNTVIFDIDVKGGVNIKKLYGEKALTIFIQPPSVEELKRRLEGRGTDSAETIQQRVDKAAYEMTFSKDFDVIIVNDDLEKAKAEALEVVNNFLKS